MNSHSLPSFYLSAPTTPGNCSPQNLQFYSSRTSPTTINNNDFDFTSTRIPPDRCPHSISTMSFADELFHNGKFLPLKPPPRLQRSVPTSPRGMRSRSRSPFAHRSKWNDDFDPFMIALEKVSEVPGGRMSVHRRSCSYSPFRGRDISRSVELEQKEPTIEPVKRLKKTCGLTECRESKMQRVKSVLLRYASGKKETNGKAEIMTIWKVSYFKKWRKKESVESKMGVKDKLLQTIIDRIGIRH